MEPSLPTVRMTAAKNSAERNAARCRVQTLPFLRKHFDEDFERIGDLMKAVNVKIE
jgi:hypothetical protein